MPESAIRTSALAGHVDAGVHGASPAEGHGVTLREVLPAALCQINGAPAEAELARELEAFGLRGEPAPRRAWTGEDLSLLWSGPGQWLAVSHAVERGDLLGSLREALAGSDATVTDLGHARTVVRIAGPRAADVLAGGCPLDLEAMAPGASATSVFGHLTVHLHRIDGTGFDLYVFRSFGLALWEHLLEGALEYGCRVEAAAGA